MSGDSRIDKIIDTSQNLTEEDFGFLQDLYDKYTNAAGELAADNFINDFGYKFFGEGEDDGVPENIKNFARTFKETFKTSFNDSETTGYRTSRRTWLKTMFALTATTVVAINTTVNTVDAADDQVNKEQAHSEGGEEEVHHNEDLISPMDLHTAEFVSALFAGIVGGQLASETIQGAPKIEMSPKTSLVMLTGWMARLYLLKEDSKPNPKDSAQKKEERIASKHSYEHELGEIKNVPITFGLATFSEITSHIQYKSAKELKRNTDKLLDQLFANAEDDPDPSIQINGFNIKKSDFVEYMNYDEGFIESLRDLDAKDLTKALGEKLNEHIYNLYKEGDIDKYENEFKEGKIENIENRIKEIEHILPHEIMLNNFLSLLTAPLGLTFTAANITDKRLTKISVQMAELEYLKNLKSNSGKSDVDLEKLWRDSQQKVVNDLNGSAGLVNLAVTTSANVVGPTLLGDPPNIFYMLKYGWKEWLDNSWFGLKFSSALSTGMHLAYIEKTFGPKSSTILFTQASDLAKTAAIAVNTLAPVTGKLLNNIGEQIENVDKLPKFFKNLGNQLAHADIGRVVVDTEGLMDSPFEKIQELFYIKDMGQLVENIKNLANNDEDPEKAAQSIREALGLNLPSNKDIVDSIVQGRNPFHDSLSEAIGKTAAESFIQEYEEILRNFETEIDQFINEQPITSRTNRKEIVEKALESLEKSGVIKGANENIRLEMSNILNDYVEVSIKKKVFENINTLVTPEELENADAIQIVTILETKGGYRIDSDEDREKLNTLVEEYIKERTHENHDSHSHEHPHTKIAHSALEVRNALLTQLWAVGSLQVLAKKGLGLDQPGLISVEKAKNLTTAVLSVIAGASSVADNVAAMLFGIDILEKIGEKAFGAEVLNQFPEVHVKLRRYAFMMAVYAGSLSKIGNGANMSIQKFASILRDDEKEILEAMKESNKLMSSFGNIWSYLAVVALLGWASVDLRNTFDKLNKTLHPDDQQSEEGHENAAKSSSKRRGSGFIKAMGKKFKI